MRHSLAQLLAASSSSSSSRRGVGGNAAAQSAAAACSCPSEGRGRRSSPDEAVAEARREEEATPEPDEPELLFPSELELDDWLEAAVAEAEPDWGLNEGAGGGVSLETLRPPLARPPPRSSSRLKAAAAARLNRQKKKQYVMGLESRLQGLAAENRQLRERNRGLCRRLRDLEREASYLRAVLANQSALGRLLSRLAGDAGSTERTGMRIRSSLFEDPAAAGAAEAASETTALFGDGGGGSSDHDYALPVPEEGEGKKAAAVVADSAGGICLHVDRDQVSVEFCSVCARRAAAASSASPSSFASKIFSFRCLPCQAPLCRG